ncbi:hypothetical protein G6F47_008550 [Rhizopus delemar]|nr:hypothetical protein G6F54_006434 [Rhizopus delemar]KAG1510251.1 hypothetical protein G6F53_006818 [Rhizopus delemar]KAG1583781.1 hypothetical protein G6F48_008305 [Rhizopus delemar]KAG1595255.1 hypothetical protein G6F47_008550 [Rhizopus delemar]KAG1639095.1 hypothetical protein G6F44_008170 [Rhizopus delemar]
MDSADVEKLTDKWFCNECEHKKGKLVEKGPKVSSDEFGNYLDSTQMRALRNKKTAVKKLMIACDYCALHWHLDCLTPPMAGLPSSAKRWRCPNHIESTMVQKSQRQQRYPDVIDADYPPNISNIQFNVVIKEEQEERKDCEMEESKEHTTERKRTDVITNKDGVVYALPLNSFRFGSSKSRDGSITTSEVSTPAAFIDSPKHSKDEIDTWLNAVIEFQYQRSISSLLKVIASTPNKSPMASPIPTFISGKQRKYQQIERLLRQKDEQEILSLICKNIK